MQGFQTKTAPKDSPLYIHAYICNKYACITHTHILLPVCISTFTGESHKNFFYSDSTSRIPSQQKYEVPQLRASGFELQALSFLWPLYRILILSFLPCISSSRVMKEIYWLDGVPSPQKATEKNKSSELHRNFHPASKLSNKTNFMENNSPYFFSVLTVKGETSSSS